MFKRLEDTVEHIKEIPDPIKRIQHIYNPLNFYARLLNEMDELGIPLTEETLRITKIMFTDYEMNFYKPLMSYIEMSLEFKKEKKE